MAHALSGRTAEAEGELARMVRAAEKRYVSPFDIATVYAALDRPEPALDWLERAVEQRAQPINCVKQDPSFRTFHSLPRFQAILERMQLR